MNKLFLFWVVLIAIPMSAQELPYRQYMRDFVIRISEYAKGQNENFVVIPQNGIELVTDNGEPYGKLSKPYLNAIDGHGQESLFFGYAGNDKPTPKKETRFLMSYLDRSKAVGNTILVTDYCAKVSKQEEARRNNLAKGYISFRAATRELTEVPLLANVNKQKVLRLSEVSNFLYLINPSAYSDRTSFIEALAATEYDLLIIDLFFGDMPLTKDEVSRLSQTKTGRARLVVCYMSIGEAEDYRYYWEYDWDDQVPTWIAAENPDWEGNYKVKYWHSEWQSIILGNKTSYLDKILEAGFDGVYLDIIDGFEYFEGTH
ncbi:hypothetical protein B7P33_02950 [Sediminicola luteus]|uniref:Glycoside-hydrolase family GH114 TIM-barrel domain-containing protein n=2 Tax=Sediminicola luteus TaxID=319238 RepID=A0A2A4GEV1_9FLAO|nr:hypothetical protein B7P33_02950 [Sediminicola luteus]